MINKPLVTFIFGTRPEAIKLAPVINAFKKSKFIRVRILLSGQHRDLVLDILKIFDIEVDENFNVMTEAPSLTKLTCSILQKLDKEFSTFLPSIVIVQGDTTTAYAAALAAFYKKIPVAHVEAGLRTDQIYSPFPEEANRRFISQIAKLHFAPTKLAEENLISSKIIGKIINTGNTVIDALLYISNIQNKFKLENVDFEKNKLILVTIHRRENWSNLTEICQGLLQAVDENQNLRVVVPMHPNKLVREPIIKILGESNKVILRESLNYLDLISILKKCYFVITDSGGIQEEAPTFRKPVLVARLNTERIEGINSGSAKLIPPKRESIYQEINLLLNDDEIYKKMSNSKNPYGDGKSSQRILDACLNELQIN